MQKLGIDYKAKLIGQGYDGASVMSRKLAGVATLIRNEAQFALYVHCHAHRLNLALEDCLKAVPQAAEFFCPFGAFVRVRIWFIRPCKVGRNSTTVISGCTGS